MRKNKAKKIREIRKLKTLFLKREREIERQNVEENKTKKQIGANRTREVERDKFYENKRGGVRYRETRETTERAEKALLKIDRTKKIVEKDVEGVKQRKCV